MDKITRFPPEPNGFLHLGHCKSIFINWDGDNKCHLRFDDTNPSVEKQEFVDNIIDDIKWLGFDPGNITWTSDYFDQLYQYAILLISNGFAYVDFTPNDLMSEQRHAGQENEYRSKSIEWNLEKFAEMTNGLYKPGECVLRLAIDMQNVNHVLRDPIAYRICLTPHHRTGSKWCIYPSYDYSHGIIDAIEGITHSYCTDEFYIRRDLYYWTPNKLIELGINLKVANEIEYGKLSVENNILSKRNINKLIEQGLILDYTDPRLLTIKGLKRRGFTPNLIKKIVDCTGFDKKETIISTGFLNHLLRDEYNAKAIRVFGIVDPIEIQIIDPLEPKIITHPNHPSDQTLGSHEIILGSKIFIESEDWVDIYIKDFYRFMPGSIVRLKYGDLNDFFTQCDQTHTIKRVDTTGLNIKKIKGCIGWVGEEDAIEVKFELFDELAPGGQFNPNSKKTYNGLIQRYVLEILDKPIQLERKGFFKFDRYDDLIPVFIQIVGLYDNKKI